MVYCATLKVMQDTNTCKMIGQLSVYHILVNQSDLLLHSTAAFHRSVASRHVQQRFSVADLCSSVNVKIPPFLDKNVATAASVLISLAAAIVCNW